MMARSMPLLSLILVAGAAATTPAETRQVTAGPQYASSGAHQVLFGADYRRLWTRPATFEVLDMQAEAGGLTPVRRVGGQQTLGLALKGADGRNYTFRGLQKDASGLLGEELRGTIVDRLLEDALAAQHPASDVVARGLLDATGIPCPGWRLVVLPDDPALGAFREAFAGKVGAFAEYPSAVSETNPGFRGIEEIVDHLELYRRLQAGGDDRVDVHALLRARLVDIFMGDWDRHRKQWRWARFPGSPLWVPIPEDRDQAFSRYQGLVASLGRQRDARLQNFGPRYAGIGGLTTNGREQDRQLLAGLTREDFREAATALRAQLTDEAIESAVALMPPEWRAIDGPRLRADLEARRDGLVEVADRFYAHLAERADVFLSDRSELVEAARQANGDLDLRARRLDASGQPGEEVFHRVFHTAETEEIRLYALGGDDRIVVTGGAHGIKVRAVGGPGDDTLDDRLGGGTRLSDSQGSNTVLRGPGTSEDSRPYEPPPPPKNAPWVPPQDFDSSTWNAPWISYGTDLGLFLGWSLQHQAYGFRKNHFANLHFLRAGYAFDEKSGRADYAGLFNRENSGAQFGLRVFGSGVEVLRFYGFGNETGAEEGEDFYRARANQVVAYPSYTLPLGKAAGFTIGPVGRYTSPRRGEPTFVDSAPYYGRSDLGQVGAHAVLVVDTRDKPAYPRRGVHVALRGTFWPKAWDVEDSYGAVSGEASGYLSAGKAVTLALRAGGRKLAGDYPYFDAATIGGGGLAGGALAEPGFTARGYRAHRFAGDGSAYANADLRLRLGHLTLVLPCHFGVFGLADVGRVWYAGESSDTWHTSYGGGLWLSFLDYDTIFSAYVAHSAEGDIVHVGGGFSF